jgi:hypothetical protein
MTKYVIAPYGPGDIAAFADELEGQKGYVKVKTLDKIGDGDKLYFLAHGADNLAGVCQKHLDNGGKVPVFGVDAAVDLHKLGLRDKRISVYLWVCWGALNAAQRPNLHATYIGKMMERPPNMLWAKYHYASFALQVASRLKKLKYKNIEVVGYRKMVNIAYGSLQGADKHKKLLNDDNTLSRVTDPDKVRYTMADVQAM